MEDRELIALAAKAVGAERISESQFGDGYKLDGNYLYWDPLNDDGQALRAANHVGLTIGQTFDGAYVDLCTGEILQKMPRGGCQHEVKWAEFNGDKNAACRKAIILCLAQIGSVMP